MSATDDEALGLDARAGLPDTVATLRSCFPRDGWRAHANFGQLAAFWLQVHASLQQEGGEVVRIVDAFRTRQIGGDAFARGFVPRLNGFLQHLDAHHRIEDHAYFPKFRQIDARLQPGFDLLEADHALIHHRLVATVEHANGLLAQLSSASGEEQRAADRFAAESGHLLELLRRHLADEEELVIPALLEHGEEPLR